MPYYESRAFETIGTVMLLLGVVLTLAYTVVELEKAKKRVQTALANDEVIARTSNAVVDVVRMGNRQAMTWNDAMELNNKRAHKEIDRLRTRQADMESSLASKIHETDQKLTEIHKKVQDVLAQTQQRSAAADMNAIFDLISNAQKAQQTQQTTAPQVVSAPAAPQPVVAPSPTQSQSTTTIAQVSPPAAPQPQQTSAAPV